MTSQQQPSHPSVSQQSSRQTIIAGNWKMFGTAESTRAFAEEMVRDPHLAHASGNGVGVVICPPTPLLHVLRPFCGTFFELGGQDCHQNVNGAFTGDVSAGMLVDAGCRYVIVGHSERRRYHHETDDVVAQKTRAALAAGLTPIVCVGETLEERQAEQTADVVLRQLDAVLQAVSPDQHVVLAYEPVWAIGTGLAATVEQAGEVHQILRKFYRQRVSNDITILYGGSVNATNAKELLAHSDIDGALVGGASLESRSFLAIVEATGV